ncbi:hypothetical protein [Kordiimonas sp. SCSIO 12610]|uniref:hypothetical protein n=1 Tax=Kordiimonas sp. SCSIO 12610 TaxID=2829597 RepID=UPI002109E36B|nr:hypothetical protein [Kordiimonas sp. SCSIO 12610]UTW56170.1 hypothetical protein KFF44_04540 [Kordiimonas sp. SCSIO 12610]
MTLTFQNPEGFKTKSSPAAAKRDGACMESTDNQSLGNQPPANDSSAASNAGGLRGATDKSKPSHRPKLSHKRKKASFIKALECGETVSSAAALLGVERSDLYAWRLEDAAFDAAWARAWSSGADMLEEEAIRRAVTGVEKPVFRGGEVVGHVRDYSDSMLMFLLKARKPELFGTSSAKSTDKPDNKQGNRQDPASEFESEIMAAKQSLDRKLLSANASGPKAKLSKQP